MTDTLKVTPFNAQRYLDAVDAIASPPEIVGSVSGDESGEEVDTAAFAAQLHQRSLERELESMSALVRSDEQAYRIWNVFVWLLGGFGVIAVGVLLIALFSGATITALVSGVTAIFDLPLVIWVGRESRKAKKSLLETYKAYQGLQKRLQKLSGGV